MPMFDGYTKFDMQQDVAEDATEIISEHGPMDLETLIRHLKARDWDISEPDEIEEALRVTYENEEAFVALDSDGKYYLAGD